MYETMVFGVGIAEDLLMFIPKKPTSLRVMLKTIVIQPVASSSMQKLSRVHRRIPQSNIKYSEARTQDVRFNYANPDTEKAALFLGMRGLAVMRVVYTLIP